MPDPPTPSGLLRALLPAALVTVILGLMIWGGIARNRDRVRGAELRHAGASKLANYGAHSMRFLEARRGSGGMWSCDGKPDPDLTRRILLNLKGTVHDALPSLATSADLLNALNSEAGGASEGPGSDPGPDLPESQPSGEWLRRAYELSLEQGEVGSGGGDSPFPVLEDLEELGGIETLVGDEPWESRDTLSLGILIHLQGESCLRVGEPCRVLDAGVGLLASRMDRAGGWRGAETPWPGQCQGTPEETTAVGLRALDTYAKVLALRASRARPGDQSLAR